MIESIRILGKPYHIKMVESFAADTEESTRLGECEFWQLEIRVREGMPDQVTRETVLHETTHAICDALGIDLTEGALTALSSGLYALAQESPEAVRYMLNLEMEVPDEATE